MAITAVPHSNYLKCRIMVITSSFASPGKLNSGGGDGSVSSTRQELVCYRLKPSNTLAGILRSQFRSLTNLTESGLIATVDSALNEEQ